MRLSDPEFDPLFEGMAQRPFPGLDATLQNRGIRVPGLSQRFNQVIAEWIRRKNLLESFMDVSFTEVVEIIRATERELPSGQNDPAFLDVFAQKLRAFLDSFDVPGPGASA